MRKFMSYDERLMELEYWFEVLGDYDVTAKQEFPYFAFLSAPASTKYHGAYAGGLFDHSYQVMQTLIELTNDLGLVWERDASPIIIGMFHDLCKIDNYVFDIETKKFIYNKENIIDGHGEKSIIYLQKYIDLTDEEIACIRWHMGAYETDTKKWDYFGRAIERYPNVLYTHTADMIASKIKGV